MGRRKSGRNIDGWVIIDKPTNIGSTPIVGKVRRGCNANKAGHAGTLDPFATGILPIALGMATKTIPFVQDADKQYAMTLQFGSTTDTLDADGTITHTCDNRPTIKAILSTIPDFLGTITQTPPAYSAIKIGGQRAYDLARRGQDVPIPERTVRIDAITITHFTTPSGECVTDWDESDDTTPCDSVTAVVTCGKGTYIRTLGADFAKKCGTVGHLTALRRTKVGIFSEKNAIPLAKFEKIVHKGGNVDDIVLSIESALVGIPVVTITADEAEKFCNGIQLPRPQRVDISDIVPMVIATTTHIYGIARIDQDNLKSIRVFYKPVPRRNI